jgi:hypothetical protein
MKRFSNRLLDKDWLLMECPSRHPFWIGDNPVTMHNDRHFGRGSGLGFRVRGIQIYLPITKILTLALWCPTLLEEMHEASKRSGSILKRFKAISALGTDANIESLKENAKKAEAVRLQLNQNLELIKEDRPLNCTPDNVVFLNSLQVTWANRYVMSSIKEFSLAHEIIRDSPESRYGPRPQVF